MEDTQPATAAPPRQDLRVHAHSLAYLFAVGASLVVVTVGFHQPRGQDEIGLLVVAALAYVAAAFLRVAWRWLPSWAFPAFVFVGTALVSVGIDRSGDGSTAYAVFYFWVAIYSFYFFPRWQAVLQLAGAAGGYAVVLWLGPESAAPAARWVLTVGTMGVAGLLVASLVDTVRERAAEVARRAEGLRLAEERTRAIIETATDGFVASDQAGRVIAFNSRAEEMSGYRRDDVLGQPLSALLVPDRLRPAFDAEMRRFVDTGHSDLLNRPVEFVGMHRDGREFPVELTITPMREQDGWVFNAFVRDITERKRADQHIRDHAEDLTRVAQMARDLSGVTDAHAARPAICRAAQELSGAKVSILYEPDAKGQELVSTAVVGAKVEQIHLPFTGRPSGATTAFSSGQALFVADLTDSSRVTQGVRDALGVQSALWQPVVRNDVPIGVLTLAWGERVEDPGERVRSLLGLLAAEAAVAIERADLLARLEAVARTDDLTGLANRRAWDEHLPRELARAEREEQPLCVAMLDLDRFKEFNDERGHQAGDRLLKQVAATWREMLRPSDLLARYGGEEFGLVLPHCPLDVGLEVVERLRTFTIGGQTCSAGVAAWNGSEPPDDLVKRADAALYEAKKAGRDQAVAAG
jgi:diguanylate cyclase (GGDEF)-like protein/PAS domain S-box-containing protein